MLGRYKFRPNQRVRPSKQGIRALLFPGTKARRGGVIVKVDEYNSPNILWDGRTTTASYHPDFIMPDRRRKNRRKAKGGGE